jgi:hypothetical protein
MTEQGWPWDETLSVDGRATWFFLSQSIQTGFEVVDSVLLVIVVTFTKLSYEEQTESLEPGATVFFPEDLFVATTSSSFPVTMRKKETK